MKKNVHLIAACGVGMASVAGMLKEIGCRVTGSDANVYPPMSTQLETLGIRLSSPYAAGNIPGDADLVIVGNAVSRDNPECVEAARRGLPTLSMPQAVADYFIRGKESVVVAGTHGKTTTTSLMAWALFALGEDPSFLVGGVPTNFPVSYRVGGGRHFVVEGDEYDTAYFDKGPKFLHYLPKVVLLTSIEFDHADIYRDLAHLKESFRRLVAIIPPDGLLVACADYPDVLEAASLARCPVVRYAREKAVPGTAAPLTPRLRGTPRTELPEAPRDSALPTSRRFAPLARDSALPTDRRSAAPEGGGAWTVRMLGENGGFTRFRMENGADAHEYALRLPGAHNAANAAAVAIALRHYGFPAARVAEALAGFAGVRRRQEVVGEFGGVLVIDDFAHHPTAVRETVGAIRSRYPGRPITAVFEPRSNTSRRKVFQKEFAEALGLADAVVLAGVFGSEKLSPGERMNPQEVVAAVARAGRPAVYIEDVDRIVAHIAGAARPGDLVLVMSNGGFGGIQGKLARALAAARP